MITAGFDIGTRFAKVCVVENGEIAGSAVGEVDRKINRVIDALYGQALKQAGIGKWRVKKKAITGYGAGMVKFSGKIFTPGKCAATGILASYPQARAMVDVGGIFIRASAIQGNGLPGESATNEKCASGGGKVLEMVAQALEMDFADLSQHVESSRSPYIISSNCAVFAESEIVSKVNGGADRADIAAGVLNLIAARTATLLERIDPQGDVAIAGGVAAIPAFKKALEDRISHNVLVPDYNPQLAAAYGAALLAGETKS